eukprot:CAMPEP_0177697352 /NCGR_PEP_ID=MMETSP0484_2-20121128/4468_1 /TAXON_ID=354590 /ORGANISM="Rhodomonas lens, Strain RHODO" /LENGTH=178 /DNA_ID=CAMNT_0019208385 /DNA_START=143 /DNA_END=676 /DNA_ORIENTATION=+
MVMLERQAPHQRASTITTVCVALACVGALVLVVYTPHGSQSGNDGRFSLLENGNMPPSPSRSFWKTQQLSYGVPESYGSETVHRMPVRSTDSMGNVLPPVAQEVQPPGYFKVTGDGSLVGNTGPAVYHGDQPLEVSGAAQILPPPAANTEGLRASTQNLRAQRGRASTLSEAGGGGGN